MLTVIIVKKDLGPIDKDSGMGLQSQIHDVSRPRTWLSKPRTWYIEATAKANDDHKSYVHILTAKQTY